MKYLVKEKATITTENWKERMGEITIEQFAKENEFEIYDDIPEQLIIEQKKDQQEKELKEINVWFQQNDYIPNKIITGEWQSSDPRWTEYLKERQVKRQRQDELTELINL